MTRERGFALITVILLMIGLAVLATGLVFAAAQQAAVAGSLTDLARARHGAEAAVAIALAEWSAAERSLDSLGEQAAVVPPRPLDDGLEAWASAERIAPEAFLVTGSAAARRGHLPPIRRTAIRLVRSLDLEELGQALDAALITGRASLGPDASVRGSVDAQAPGAAPLDPAAVELCARWPTPAAAIRAPAGTVILAANAELTGSPPVAADPDAGRFLDSVARLAVGPLEPPASDVAPTRPVVGSAIEVADSVLTLRGGSGQGILVAHRDLVLEGGFTFQGIVIALGTVTMRDASVTGTVLAPRVDLVRGNVSLDRCAIADALASSAAMRAAYLPARSWLPTFD